MLAPRTRREFLAEVGRGTLVASLGIGLGRELGFVSAFADDVPASLSFGALDPLVALMQETPVDKLLPLLVERLSTGTDLKTLVAAGALANARTFGGEDYVGMHTVMAIAPAWRMAQETSEPRRALPVLKVLYRNTNRIQEVGGRAHEVLRPVEPAAVALGRGGGEALRDAVRAKDVGAAERTFAALARGTATEALDHLLLEVDDSTEVHRVVLPYRAWDLAEVVGREHAHTLLRQSVRYCVQEEGRPATAGRSAEIRALLPALLERHGLLGRVPEPRPADDAAVEATSKAIFEAKAADAAELAAAALEKGMPPEALGEAIALAANQLLLRDAGRSDREARPGKPAGSVHGDSIGVHACDSANAWRTMALVGNVRNRHACLIHGAYQAAGDRVGRGGDFLNWRPRPDPEDVAKVEAKDPEALLREAEGAIRERDQARAAAVIHRYGALGHGPRPAFDLMRRYATSEDGALHAEKYFRTASEEFAAGRPAFRWRHLVSLARVTASSFGHPAPGYADACRLLKA
jgi:hypothetical protein